MNTDDYYKILNNSIFAPIPHGYFHPETYRLYEALEAGSIPIIENPFKFFDDFLPNNPLPSVNSWEDSSIIIKKYLENKKDIEILGDKINDWWTQHKENLKETFLIIKNV
jgi:hypothetical protein